jgi:hypothetical protein
MMDCERGNSAFERSLDSLAPGVMRKIGKLEPNPAAVWRETCAGKREHLG